MHSDCMYCKSKYIFIIENSIKMLFLDYDWKYNALLIIALQFYNQVTLFSLP